MSVMYNLLCCMVSVGYCFLDILCEVVIASVSLSICTSLSHREYFVHANGSLRFGGFVMLLFQNSNEFGI